MPKRLLLSRDALAGSQLDELRLVADGNELGKAIVVDVLRGGQRAYQGPASRL